MISAVVLAKNEGKNIEDCIKNIKWCDEIIVIDDNSKDNTVELAKKLGAKVFEHNLNNDFSSQRNYGLEKAREKWVLFVDGDERVTEPLKNEILNLFIFRNFAQEIDGYLVRRKDFMWGKELKHGEMGSAKLLRLAKKNMGEWMGKVHEEWKIKGNISQLKNSLVHYPHQGIEDFLKEINFYTSLRAEEIRRKRVKIFWATIFLYPLGKFLFNYFIKLGFLDGMSGLVVAIIMSFHSFLARSKAWIYVHSR